ncbi:MAG TPA: hypothetical protein VMZ50_07915, partial [Phycisphaerae bacterium]|nr:hypothetical protein [Phycisphaerae bacterium]
QFVLARSLPYDRRLLIVLGLLVLGFAAQMLLSTPPSVAPLGLILGAALLLAATLLTIVRGFSNIPEGLRGQREWRGATREQLHSVLRIARKSKRWDQSAVDITCATGIVSLIGVVAAVAAVAYLLWRSDEEWLARAWVLDAAVLLLPHWVTGVRRVLTNDPLTLKVRNLLVILDTWQARAGEGEVMTPQMEVRSGEKGEMPTDAKLVLRWERLGDAFLGLQVQVVLNRVQGSDYPYLYCVLVARPEMNMLEKLAPRPSANIVVEGKRDGEVDILVIRNRTTKTSGYHTPPAVGLAIFHYAWALGRELLET